MTEVRFETGTPEAATQRGPLRPVDTDYHGTACAYGKGAMRALKIGARADAYHVMGGVNVTDAGGTLVSTDGRIMVIVDGSLSRTGDREGGDGCGDGWISPVVLRNVASGLRAKGDRFTVNAGPTATGLPVMVAETTIGTIRSEAIDLLGASPCAFPKWREAEPKATRAEAVAYFDPAILLRAARAADAVASEIPKGAKGETATVRMAVPTGDGAHARTAVTFHVFAPGNTHGVPVARIVAMPKVADR